MNYETSAKMIKALADSSRLKILDLLSCGEMCACDILEHFPFTQPTLSHHMKILTESNLVSSKKIDKWHYYTLNLNQCNKIMLFLMQITTDTQNCICKNNNQCICNK